MKHIQTNIIGFKISIKISRNKKSSKSSIYLTFPTFIKSAYIISLFILWFFVNTLFSGYIPNTYSPENPFPSEMYQSLISKSKEGTKKNIDTPKPIVFNGLRHRKQVALTFDADMTTQMKTDLENGFVQSYYDKTLVDTLVNTSTKATLFLSGMWIESYKKEAKELSQNPLFELGNHTYSHLAFHGACYGLSLALESEKAQEVIKTQNLLNELKGEENVLFRFPGGCYSEADLEFLKKQKLLAIQWDVAGQDGFNSDTQNIVSNVVDNVRNGSIIVLHMNGYPNDPATAHALPLIIANLKERGYEFVTVSEILDSEIAKKPESIKLVYNYPLSN